MKPSIVLSNSKEQCLTFYWDESPGYYLGYRFWEGAPTRIDQRIRGYETQPQTKFGELPDISPAPTSQASSANWKDGWQTAYSNPEPNVGNQLSFHLYSGGIANIKWIEENSQQQCEWYFQPFDYGVRIWATLTTLTNIQGSYCLQQCLRFTGMFNAKWRQAVAHMPFLSELDMQAMGNANGTLTYACQNQKWLGFPVQYTVFPTCTEVVDVFHLEKDVIDHGLIVRESPKRQVAPTRYWDLVAPGTSWEQMTSGMYWERTAWISNRHPADCVHAAIDFGPLAAGQSRTLHGAVYFIVGSKDDLFELWQKDFKDAAE